MTNAIANLSSEPDKLTRHILTLQNEIEQLRHQMKALAKENELLDALLKQARQLRFSRKTERFDVTQLSLLDEDIDVDISTLETKLASPLIDAPSKKDAPHRQTLPESLPREEIRLEPASSCCPDCGQALRFVRDEINEVLDYLPGKFIVRKTVRPQYSCSGCQTIHSAQLPTQLIDKGQVGTGLLTQIVINKCVDHLPLYRQQAIFRRAGIDLSISTLCDWMGKTGVALEPLVDSMNAPISLVTGLDFSDHRNFWAEGFNALMVTDTAFFRNKNCHELEDTAEKLDYLRMAKVVQGIHAVVQNY